MACYSHKSFAAQDLLLAGVPCKSLTVYFHLNSADCMRYAHPDDVRYLAACTILAAATHLVQPEANYPVRLDALNLG